MATPHVAGAAALLWSADPSLTAQEVKDRILQGADYIGDKNPTKPTRTNGRLNVANALRPDLRSLALEGLPVSVNGGADFTVTRRYAVAGSTPANFAIAYYL